MHAVSQRAWGLRLRGTRNGSRLAPAAVLPSPSVHRVGVPDVVFRSSIPCPLMPLSTLRRRPRGRLRKTQGQVVRYSFPVGLFHSLLHAGLSRRSDGRDVPVASAISPLRWRPRERRSLPYQTFDPTKNRLTGGGTSLPTAKRPARGPAADEGVRPTRPPHKSGRCAAVQNQVALA